MPGIILGYGAAVLRTDQLLCDALLGEGNALDAYAQRLQTVALAERQAQVAAAGAAVAERNGFAAEGRRPARIGGCLGDLVRRGCYGGCVGENITHDPESAGHGGRAPAGDQLPPASDDWPDSSGRGRAEQGRYLLDLSGSWTMRAPTPPLRRCQRGFGRDADCRNSGSGPSQ